MKRKKQIPKMIFAGLFNLNDGFDAAAIGHYSPEDFLKVIDRCEAQAVVIYGIEVFTISSRPVQLETVEINPDNGDEYGWARRLASKYFGQPGTSICATYSFYDPRRSKQRSEMVDFEAALGGRTKTDRHKR